MNEPKKDWNEFFRKNKTAILIAAAVVLALSYFSGSDTGTNQPVTPVVVGTDVPVTDTGIPATDTSSPVGPPMSIDEWNRDQDRKQKKHEEFVETVIREEQTCPNGEVISIHSQCASE
jgi:hypothetical protein